MAEAGFESKAGNKSGVRIITVKGPFTLRNVMDFQNIFHQSEDPVTLVDLSGVPYIDSAALGAIISVHTSSVRRHSKYAITGVGERLRSIIEMTGVGNILVTYPTTEDAESKLA
jgi:anti-sigma B factor antagonist